MTSVPQLPLPIFAGKLCTKCGATKPESEYYVKVKLTGRLFSWCKSCHYDLTYRKDPEAAKRRVTRWQVANRDRVNQGRRTGYATAKARDPEAFREEQRAVGERRKDQRAAYRAATAEQRKAYNDAYRQAHRDEIRAKSRAYYAAHPEEIADRQRAYMAAHPEQYRELHRSWKAANKDAVNASTHKRRAAIRGDGNSWTAAEWEALKRAYDYRCLMCGKREPDSALCFDHVIPVSLGGPNTIANAQPLCKGCNSKKHRRILDLRKGTVHG